MPEGPPTKIRFLPEQVKEQLRRTGLKQVDIYNELQKHFLVVGKRPLFTHNPSLVPPQTAGRNSSTIRYKRKK